MSAWFTTTTIEERVGGAISFDFGDENCGEDISSGKVTGWDPPVRVAYEEYGWNGDAPPVATEVTVTSRSGDRCVVRMVHTMVTDKDDWDDELESFETGWPGFFEILKIYLADFAGAQAAAVRAMAVHPEGEAQAWSTMTDALNIAGAERRRPLRNTRRRTPTGRHRRAHPPGRELPRGDVAHRRNPRQGVAVVGACTVGDEGRAMASIYFYGADAADDRRRRTAEVDVVAAWPPRRRGGHDLACTGAPAADPALCGRGVARHGAVGPGADHAMVRAVRWQRHPGDFRCGRWWFVRQDGRLPTHVGRLAARRRRYPGVHRRQRNGTGDPRRSDEDADGRLHARLRVRHRAQSRRRPAVRPGGSQPLVGRRHEEPDLQHHAGVREGAVPVQHRSRQRHREPRDPAIRARGRDGRQQGNGSPATAARSSSTPPTAARPRGAWRSTTPSWSRSCGGFSPAR